MNANETHAIHGPSTESILGGIAGGSITEGIGAIGAIVLTVIGLAGIMLLPSGAWHAAHTLVTIC